jgi:hydroxymethylpyrimidine/phosphomethylpyrimidine kinase
MTAYHRALTIAGSDSGGGAGIQADLKTFSALGCYGMSVITALTAQNTREVTAVHAAPVEVVVAQLDAVLSDIGADAIKIGMLLSPEITQAVGETLRRWRAGPVVLDPVMVAKSGDRLLTEPAVLSLRKHVFPLADLVTPNLPEAAALLGRPVEGRGAMEQAAIELLGLGPKAVLLKGGHLDEAEASADVLVWEDEGHHLMRRWFEYPRIATVNTHGTGCTLSSAVAAYLARGMRLEAAVERARAYVQRAIEAGAGYELGKGHGPVQHFHGLWRETSQRMGSG